MSSGNKPPSTRFQSARWVERSIPVILGVLVLALIVTLVIIVLSLAGMTPGI